MPTTTTRACCGACSKAAAARARTSTAARAPCSRSRSSASIWSISTASTSISRCCALRRSASCSTRSPARPMLAAGSRANRGARGRTCGASGWHSKKDAAGARGRARAARMAGAGARPAGVSRRRMGRAAGRSRAAGACRQPDRSRAIRMEALSEGEAAALAAVASVLSRLQGARDYDPGLKEILDVLEPAQIQLQEAVYSLRHYRQRLDLDPQRLREVEQRLEAVHTAARKFAAIARSCPSALADTQGAAGRSSPRVSTRRLRATRGAKRRRPTWRRAAKLIHGAQEGRACDLANKVSAGDADAGHGRRPLRDRAEAAAGGQRARSGAGRIPGCRPRRRDAATAGESGLRRRTVAPEPRDPDRDQRGRRGADADLRRSRRRHRRARRRDRRAHAEAAGRTTR